MLSELLCIGNINITGCILISDVKVDESKFVLGNIYNPNTETEQVATLHDLNKMLETIKDLYDKHSFSWRF